MCFVELKFAITNVNDVWWLRWRVLEIKIYDFYFFLLARFTTGQCLKGQFTPFSCAFIEHREWVVEMRCVRFHNLELDNPFWWYEKSIETQYEAWVVEKMSEFSSLISLRDSFMSDKADSDEWKRIFLESSAHLRTRVRARAWKIVNPRGFTTNDETRKKISRDNFDGEFHFTFNRNVIKSLGDVAIHIKNIPNCETMMNRQRQCCKDKVYESSEKFISELNEIIFHLPIRSFRKQNPFFLHTFWPRKTIFDCRNVLAVLEKVKFKFLYDTWTGYRFDVSRRAISACLKWK